jgi:uncharacterized membrane protein
MVSSKGHYMIKYLLLYTSFIIVFLIVDLLWLGMIAKDFYKASLGSLMLDKPKLVASMMFYVLYSVGIMIFVMRDAYDIGHWQHAALYGALFGFFAYTTYDLSNLATIRGFPLRLAVVDMIWGSFATGLSAAIATMISLAISRQL